MTGIGGDMFCLYFDAKTKKVHALNGSGRSPAGASLEDVRKELGLEAGQSDEYRSMRGKTGSIPMNSPLAVTVPGAAAGWVDTIEKFGSGKLSLEQILTPAIELGEEGYPVSELVAKLVRIVPASPNSIIGHLRCLCSGRIPNILSEMPLPISAKSSSATVMPSTSHERLCRENSSGTLP